MYVLVWLCMTTREIIVSESTQHPNSAWMVKQTEAPLAQTLNRDEKPSHAVRSARMEAEHVDRQINRMESALESDPDLVIGTAKELVETACHTILDSCGKAVTDKPDLLPLVRRTLEELKLLPDRIADEVKRARSVKSRICNLDTRAGLGGATQSLWHWTWEMRCF
jgi:hypothetical protein